jgi:hypothetical protein
MRNKRGKLSVVLITMLACTFVTSMASAAIVQLDAIDSGWYTSDGYHSSINENYFVGDIGSVDGVHRNFFVFDLAFFFGPFDAAALSIYNPSVGNDGGDGYNSANPTETWALWEVYHSIAQLTANHAAGDPVGLSIYDDLGGTTPFGSRTVSAADNGTMVNVPLNANALASINATIGSQWAIGGSLTTLDAVANYEYLFGDTDETKTRRLILTTCDFSRGQVCYSYCPMGSCPPSYCTVYVPGMVGDMNVGRITYYGCTPGACAPSQCVVYIPTP